MPRIARRTAPQRALTTGQRDVKRQCVVGAKAGIRAQQALQAEQHQSCSADEQDSGANLPHSDTVREDGAAPRPRRRAPLRRRPRRAFSSDSTAQSRGIKPIPAAAIAQKIAARPPMTALSSRGIGGATPFIASETQMESKKPATPATRCLTRPRWPELAHRAPPRGTQRDSD